jgi:hypothetical protein
MISMAEHYLKIPSIPILGIFQGVYQIRLLDQIRTQHTCHTFFCVFAHELHIFCVFHELRIMMLPSS